MHMARRAVLLAALALAACGGGGSDVGNGGGGGGGGGSPPPPPPANITLTVSVASVTSIEGDNERPQINYTATAPDGPLSLVPLSGPDADDFGQSIGGTTLNLHGSVTMRGPDNQGPDYEYPRDANGD